jgi:membrane-associated phospholipid phosphatase
MISTLVVFDLTVSDWFVTLHGDGLTTFFTFITLFGEWKILFPTAFCVSLVLYYRNKKNTHIFPFWISLLGSSITTYTLKLFFARPRPLQSLVVENSFSFPSAHATLAVAVYGFLIYLVVKKGTARFSQQAFIFLGVIFILTIGMSRLYLGVHYVSDVLVGYIIGLAGIFLGAYVHTKKNKFVSK